MTMLKNWKVICATLGVIFALALGAGLLITETATLAHGGWPPPDIDGDLLAHGGWPPPDIDGDGPTGYFAHGGWPPPDIDGDGVSIA